MSLSRVNFRIALTFTLLSTIVSIILFYSLAFLLNATLKNEDYKQLGIRLRTMEAQYNSGGINGITSKIDITDMIHDGRPYFIRIERGVIRFNAGPESWKKSFDYNLLSGKDSGEMTTLTSSRFSYKLDVLSLVLEDGTLIQTGISDYHRYQLVKILNKVFFILLIPLLIISFIFGLYYSSKTLKPVTDLTETIREIISTGKRKKELKKYGTNELAELTVLFNTLFSKNENLIVGMKETLDNVSHDLRTPLTRIRGVSELALTSEDPHRWRESLSDIIEDIDTIIKILNALLDITAAENGVLNLNRTSFNIGSLLEQSVDLYSFIAEEKGIVVELENNLDKNLFFGDENKLRQVVSNLLDNAVKYSGESTTVAVIVENSENEIQIKVKDKGIGIPKEEQQNIFRRLYRSTRSRNEPGLGLGLSMVKAIVNSHYGEVEVESNPGEGSTFNVRLPFQNGNN